MMSKKCKYAIKALIELAKNADHGSMFTGDIAKNQNIPRKFLEQILTELKQGGFVGSKKGYGGGITLKKNADKITVADVYRLFDGAIALVPCVAYTYYEKCEDCTDEKTCTLKREFAKIREQTRDIMKETTIQSFLIPVKKK
jgi:Rrf2 family protein